MDRGRTSPRRRQRARLLASLRWPADAVQINLTAGRRHRASTAAAAAVVMQVAGLQAPFDNARQVRSFLAADRYAGLDGAQSDVNNFVARRSTCAAQWRDC